MTAVEYQTSVATNAAGIDNAGSKWSREAQTKFVPRGLRQDSIINGSLFHYNRKYFVNPHLFATEPDFIFPLSTFHFTLFSVIYKKS